MADVADIQTGGPRDLRVGHPAEEGLDDHIVEATLPSKTFPLTPPLPSADKGVGSAILTVEPVELSESHNFTGSELLEAGCGRFFRSLWKKEPQAENNHHQYRKNLLS